MTPAELLAEVTAAGLRVDLTDDGSLYVQPRERITPDLIDRLKAAKPELIEHLRRARLAEQQRRRDQLCARSIAGLSESPDRQRAVVIEPTGDGTCVAAVAVRMADGSVAVAFLTRIRGDCGELLTAFDRACTLPIQ